MNRHGCRARKGPALALAALSVAGMLAACEVPVSSNLDEGEANRVVVALDRASIDVSKEPDPAAEGKFRLMVRSDDVPHALVQMQEEGVPRAHSATLADALGKTSLVPSEASEQVGVIAAIAGELERSLEGIDGVASARVHLSPLALGAALGGPGRETATFRPSASVLVAFRGATPPIAADSIQRLVAGAVPGVAPSDVSVVLLPRSSASSTQAQAGAFAHVGPLAVARSSLRATQALLIFLLVSIGVLASALLLLLGRLSRNEPPTSHAKADSRA